MKAPHALRSLAASALLGWGNAQRFARANAIAAADKSSLLLGGGGAAKLRGVLDARIDLLDDAGGAVGAHLSKAAHVGLVEAEGNQRVAAPVEGLLHHTPDGVVAAAVQQVCEPTQLPARDRLQHHPEAGRPVARPHRDPVHGSEHFDYAVPGHVEHGCSDNARSFGEAMEVLEVAERGL